jgi:hypothetical protein
MGIFSDHAPKLWDAGLPVIPLWAKSKKPALHEWSQFCRRTPTAEEKSLWLDTMYDGNVGLPLGPASGLVAFDVDTTDQGLIELIEKLMPVKSPWKRIGAKGWVAVFKYGGEKSFQIKDEHKKVICELLSDGRQVVLPPSIHPDTGREYVANADIAEVVRGYIPALPPDFERALRASLESKGTKLSMSGYSKVTEWMPRSSRDNKYTAICGA